MIQQYYLTEMNTLKLENVLLKFIHHQKIDPILTNGIVAKISAMLYDNYIDYYYADAIATAADTDIKFVDNVYLKGYHYNKPLAALLTECKIYKGSPADAKAFEEDIKNIIETKRIIKLKRIN